MCKHSNSYPTGWGVKYCSHFGKQFGISTNSKNHVATWPIKFTPNGIQKNKKHVHSSIGHHILSDLLT